MSTATLTRPRPSELLADQAPRVARTRRADVPAQAAVWVSRTDRPVPPASLPASAPPPLRLTQRGRLVMVLVLAAVLAVLAVLISPGSAASPDAPPPATLVAHVVQPGDTLWGLARELAPRNDPREIVAQISELNDLGSRVVQVGEQILLPVPA